MKFLSRCAFGVLCIMLLPAKTIGSPPNIIIINIDDLGYGDIGPFGSGNATPNINKMAKEGRRLLSHYADPVCSPSRAALLTGSYPKRVLPIPHVLFPGSAVGLAREEWTIADILKTKGYATAIVGKWHLGDQPEFLPNQQGFDYYFGIPYSNDMGPIPDGTKSNPGEKMPTESELAERYGRIGNLGGPEVGIKLNQPPLPLLENGNVVARVRQPEQRELTGLLTQKAVAFIKENKSRPFFLYLPHVAVHFPLYPDDPHLGSSNRGLLADWVREVDDSVGQVLDEVRAQGLGENTIVVFTSDNGGALGQGSSNFPLRGGKGQTFEGGVRVPTIVWYPGVVPADSSTSAITSSMDFLPTFARLAGAVTPSGNKIDGVDIWSAITGEADAGPRESFFYFRGLALQAVRLKEWKLFVGSGELYNLQDDVAEKNDVAKAHPDVVAQIRRMAALMDEDLGIEGLGPGCRPIGKVENASPILQWDGAVRAEFSGLFKMLP